MLKELLANPLRSAQGRFVVPSLLATNLPSPWVFYSPPVSTTVPRTEPTLAHTVFPSVFSSSSVSSWVLACSSFPSRLVTLSSVVASMLPATLCLASVDSQVTLSTLRSNSLKSLPTRSTSVLLSLPLAGSLAGPTASRARFGSQTPICERPSLVPLFR